MGRRRLALLAVLVSALLMVVASLHPTWFTLSDTGRAYLTYWDSDAPTLAPRAGRADARLGAAGRGVTLVALAAVPLLIAAAMASLRGRIPFLLRVLTAIAVAAFGLMSFITWAEMSSSVKRAYEIGPGFALGVVASLVGLIGIALLVEWRDDGVESAPRR